MKMNEEKKLKILFFACHSTTLLLEYWRQLKDSADCYWLTTHALVNDELNELGIKNVIYRSPFGTKAAPGFLYKVVRKIKSYFIKINFNKFVGDIIDEIAPDIVISNTTLVLAKYVPQNPKTMKVQIFHSVPYKNYIMVPETLAYDLVLLPSDYHKQTLISRFKTENVDRFKVVGWPRADLFLNNGTTDSDRNIFMTKLGLDPGAKTVLFAPTWDAFYDKGLFPLSFGHGLEAFELFCRQLKEMGVNFMVKLHPYAQKLIDDPDMHKIAEKYSVHLAYKKTNGVLDGMVKSYLGITDVLISDMSGIITDFMILNRPIIYLEPDVDPDGKEIKWNEADLPKDYRAGKIVGSMDGLVQGVKQSLANPDEYKSERDATLRKLFFKLDGSSSERAANEILSSYNEFIKEGRVS